MGKKPAILCCLLAITAAFAAGFLAGRRNPAAGEPVPEGREAAAVSGKRSVIWRYTAGASGKPGTAGDVQSGEARSNPFRSIMSITDTVARNAAWADFVLGLEAGDLEAVEADVDRWYVLGGSLPGDFQLLHFRKGQLLGAKALESDLPEGPDGSLGKNHHSLMRGWASAAPWEAKAWIDALPDGSVKNSLVMSWYHGAIADNPSMAARLFAELPEHARSAGIDPLVESVHREEGLDGLFDWFSARTKEESGSIPLQPAFNKMAWRLGQLSAEDPAAVEAILLDPANLPYVSEGAFNVAVRNLSPTRPGRTIELAAKLQEARPEVDERQMRGMVGNAVKTSTRRTINNVAEWLVQNESHPLRDMTARYLVEHAATLDPEAAARWAAAIKNPGFRAEAEHFLAR